MFEEIPLSKKPISCKWVYKTKYKGNNLLHKHKARLVAKGFAYQEGVDYEEAFTAIVKMVMINLVPSLTTHLVGNYTK